MMRNIVHGKNKRFYIGDRLMKETKELNCIGYPHNDPYGLSAAFWKIFTKPEVEKQKKETEKLLPKIKKQSAKDFY
jgi:hypothetical protein